MTYLAWMAGLVSFGIAWESGNAHVATWFGALGGCACMAALLSGLREANAESQGKAE